MALTKGEQTILDAWAVTANGAVRLGTELDVSSAYSCELDIKAVLGEAVASTGQPEVIIMTTGKASPAKDDWSPFLRMIGPSGTPVTPLALNIEALAGETVITCTNPVTAGIDNDGKYKFIKNTTLANSEVIFQTANSGDAGDTITILDGLTHTQDGVTSTIMDIDDVSNEVVSQWSLTIDCIAIKRIRIVYNADKDSDGPDVICHAAYTLCTGL